MKRTDEFVVKVEFRADSEKALDHAVRSYQHDPSTECAGCNVDLGCYGWKQGKPKLHASKDGRTR